MADEKRSDLTLPFSLDQVLEELREEPEGLPLRELGKRLSLSREGQKARQRLLGRLQGAGLLRKSGQDYQLSRSRRVQLGQIRQRRRKMIQFIPESPEERVKGRIRVEPEGLGGAFDGDRVIATISSGPPGSPEGERSARVELVVARSRLLITGRLRQGFRQSWVESLDEKFPFDIDLESEEVSPYADGWVVVVEVTSYPSGPAGMAGPHRRHAPRGRIVEGLGSSSTAPGMDIEIVIRKHDLPHIFPAEVLEEAATISPVVTSEQISGRLDLRGLPTVTIDGEAARDFDDAISLQRRSDGDFELGVHIADVSHYVRAGTPLDFEAQLRGTSVYFPERALPMLPESLSNGICSLNPQVDRLTISALMVIDQSGKVRSYQIRESVIRSDERMTYTAVNHLLRHLVQQDQPDLARRYSALLDLFRTMEELARVLIGVRMRRGAIDFNLPESVFEFDDEGRVAGVLKAERNIAHRIIEEFMLLANETVAGHLERLGVPSIYRIHEAPTPQRVLEFAELARAYGHRFPAADASSQDYQHLSKRLEGRPEERVLSHAMLRSLQRARYSVRNEGHFGLAAPVYTHFTSPIRRYPDLLVHRILRELFRDSTHWGDSARVSTPDISRPQWPRTIRRTALELMAIEASERERAADAAEAEIDEWRKAVFMAERIGEEFAGLIIQVKEFGLFVELDDVFIEGLVAVRHMTDDFYRYDARTHTLTGANGRRRFKIGDRVKVRVERVDPDRHQIDLAIVDAPQKHRSARRRRR